MNFNKLLSIISTLFLSSCMSSAPLQLRIDVAKQLNPDTYFASLPVRLKVYQLSDLTLFNEATFSQLWKSDTTVLASTLLDKKELTINPGEKQQIKISRNAQAEYIAVVGIFMRHADNSWKTVKRLPGHTNSLAKHLILTAKGYTVELK